jgi:Type III restriction enzyme, res subunit
VKRWSPSGRCRIWKTSSWNSRGKSCRPWGAGGSRTGGILTLPTGAGKTRTAVEAILEWKRSAGSPAGVLWIAQSDELCEQAVEAFRDVWGHRDSTMRDILTLNRFWRDRSRIPDDDGITVASIQKLHAARRRDSQGLRDQDLQEMLAPSYAEVLRFLGLEAWRRSEIDELKDKEFYCSEAVIVGMVHRNPALAKEVEYEREKISA